MIRVNSCNYLLQKITQVLVSNYFIIHRIHDLKKVYKVVKFIDDIHNLLKNFFLLLPSKQTNLSTGGLWVVRLVSQQCHTKYSVWAIHNVNHLLNKLQVLLHIFGQCRLKNWEQILVSEKVICCT